ncbi:MAG TPA: 2-amino-4-hydroxy-6-hydroxymethyldihydropteridine diphosphokinase [Muricauda sp.]|uniref:2-amino-4-hydroxy-6-hydroxymethyldihydropteridine pyrophosphokinase n=1 Tax=Flagellimonas aurea TaxID=2915619 RepID=A0ABS3G6C3_9FLAO|nr:2-amino-4-hydroxy-6-hydroxymethyldihydropteridine diphosphokinase [Allomuricauda aurea]MAO18402.1 2-amino-4-hydroxy-6-hydroxymethyldihydropteridine diphosphokinase [Allomuricauda sp.]UBZ12637.1 2-amino-4-hydroxy-6-hydroxymethyldihydropteridine diphosphokinase [Allomuricauda aquimarina]MBC71910.1 2-amino-4-hydroxy-6-hydroxymethyldihydropteridine diphosphokinase [Allomuricauda sp.]MBO0354609.1 2-amino-4-hydroxy-6-hydroxymethyldihydropteridine diphosphokinase [Allomuricauda aurea]HBU77970.1 2-|tara:strand:+ start:1284 stop:2429 length:1146 start_codon:yes stop_codon:yes gene_type:complete
MVIKQKVYLSLGSNVGNRHANLQKAIFRIQQRVGSILGISSVYENPAIGFEGDDFLNIAISLLTPLHPKELLENLLQIEQDFGRVRSIGGGYSSRTLDIDIIYYGNEVIQNEDLVVPHPQMQHRNFVLKPLADIAPQFYHPVLYKDTRNLLQECRDKTSLTKVKYQLFKDRAGLFSQLQFIAIEGNIGAGKTTLSKMISEDFNAKLVLERFADNPFLPKFYEDQSRYAFPLEMSFLADRYQQFMDDTSQFDLFKNFMVSDYDIFKSLIFAKVTLQNEEFNLYRKVFNFMYKEVKKPDIYLYLYQNTERLLANIKKRGRDYEQNIDPAYLERINRGYMDFIKGHPSQNSVILDMENLDFVNNPADYEFILQRLEDNMLSSNI